MAYHIVINMNMMNAGQNSFACKEYVLLGLTINKYGLVLKVLLLKLCE